MLESTLSVFIMLTTSNFPTVTTAARRAPSPPA
jgi:hypothetical protein